MIQIDSLKKSTQANSEVYSLTINRVKMIFPPILPLSSLTHFSHPVQHTLGKTPIRFDLTSFTSLSFYHNTNYIIMTNFQQILIIPYLLRLLPTTIILTTGLMAELSRIHIHQFYQTIIKHNTLHHTLSTLPQQNIFDNYENQFNIDLTTWQPIYTEQEVENCLTRIVKINYYQKYDTGIGIVVIPYPSGENAAAAMWHIQHVDSKTKVLWVGAVSAHRWRCNLGYNLQRMENNLQGIPYYCIIFSHNSLTCLQTNIKSGQLSSGHHKTDQQQCLELIKHIRNSLQHSISIQLRIVDPTKLLDILAYLFVEMQGVYKCIFIKSSSFHNFARYCNSYVEYLSILYRQRIFKDPPQYPLSAYFQMRQKDILITAELQQIALNNKLPIKQILLRNLPYIYCVNDYTEMLDGGQQLLWMQQHGEIDNKVLDYGNNFTYEMLNNLLIALKPKHVVMFNQGVDSNKIQGLQCSIARAQFNNCYVLEGNSQQWFYNCTGLTNSILHKYTLTNGQLQTQPYNKQFKYIPRDWCSQMCQFLIGKQLKIIFSDEQSFSTASSKLALKDYKFYIESNSLPELIAIQQAINAISKEYKL